MLDCQAGKGWVSRGRNGTAPPAPVPGMCSDPGCAPGTNDADWRVVNLPHDFVVENDPSQSADKSHGYLPYSSYWYRKHFTLPASAAGATIYIEVEAAQTKSQVYLNGFLLGTHDFGYTPNNYFFNSTVANVGGDNLLAIFVDASEPDSWWYDGATAKAANRPRAPLPPPPPPPPLFPTSPRPRRRRRRLFPPRARACVQAAASTATCG